MELFIVLVVALSGATALVVVSEMILNSRWFSPWDRKKMPSEPVQEVPKTLEQPTMVAPQEVPAKKTRKPRVKKESKAETTGTEVVKTSRKRKAKTEDKASF